MLIEHVSSAFDQMRWVKYYSDVVPSNIQNWLTLCCSCLLYHLDVGLALIQCHHQWSEISDPQVKNHIFYYSELRCATESVVGEVV